MSQHTNEHTSMAQDTNEEGGRLGLCCEQCQASETADKHLKCCAQCKQVHYCSAECQKQHWPAHKQACQAHKARREPAKAAIGKEFVRSQDKWIKESGQGLLMLVHNLLGNHTHTHLVHLVTQYHPGKKSEFKIIDCNVLSLEDLQAMSEQIHSVLIEEIQTKERNQQQQQHQKVQDTTVVGYALLVGVKKDLEGRSYPRLIPFAREADDAAPSGATPERLIQAVNKGMFNTTSFKPL